MEPLMVSMDSANDNSYDNLSSKYTHAAVKNSNDILEIELRNLNAKRIQASKDLKANKQMVDIYKKQMLFLDKEWFKDTVMLIDLDDHLVPFSQNWIN